MTLNPKPEALNSMIVWYLDPVATLNPKPLTLNPKPKMAQASGLKDSGSE